MHTNYVFFPIAQQTLVDQGLLITEDSRSHSVLHNILGNTPLNEWSARRRDLYLTTHNTHNRQTSMLQAVFETKSQQVRGQTLTS
jgi:hypothetical protein